MSAWTYRCEAARPLKRLFRLGRSRLRLTDAFFYKAVVDKTDAPAQIFAHARAPKSFCPCSDVELNIAVTNGVYYPGDPATTACGEDKCK